MSSTATQHHAEGTREFDTVRAYTRWLKSDSVRRAHRYEVGQLNAIQFQSIARDQKLDVGTHEKPGPDRKLADALWSIAADIAEGRNPALAEAYMTQEEKDKRRTHDEAQAKKNELWQSITDGMPPAEELAVRTKILEQARIAGYLRDPDPAFDVVATRRFRERMEELEKQIGGGKDGAASRIGGKPLPEGRGAQGHDRVASIPSNDPRGG